MKVEHGDVEMEAGSPISRGHGGQRRATMFNSRGVEQVTHIGGDYFTIFEAGYYNMKSWFIKEPGITFDGYDVKQPNKPFFLGHKEKIVTYNGYSLRHLLTPFVSKDLSVCFNGSVWTMHVCFVLYAIILMLIIVENFLEETEQGTPEKPISACSVTMMGKTMMRNVNMCKFNTLMDAAKSEFRFLVAFILAGYVATAVSTWKERRTDYASLCGNCRNTLVNINTLLPATATTDTGQVIYPRKLGTRYLLLAFELAVLKSRGHMDSDQGKAYVTDLGLLEPGEWDCMVKGDRHTSALFWLQNLAASHDPYSKLIFDISDFRAKGNDMMSSLNRDPPFAYVAICGLLVKLNVFIFSTWKAVEWSLWMKMFGYSGAMWQLRFWADLLVLFVWNVSYMGLYDLGYYLSNPFGNRRIDVPHELISAGLHRLGAGFSDMEGKVIPQQVAAFAKMNRDPSIAPHKSSFKHVNSKNSGVL